MPAIQAPDRQQITFMNKLDDLVVADHPVRLLDVLIDRIIQEDPSFFDYLAPQASAGHRGYSAGCISAADGVRQVSVFHGAGWRHGYAGQIEEYCRGCVRHLEILDGPDSA